MSEVKSNESKKKRRRRLTRVYSEKKKEIGKSNKKSSTKAIAKKKDKAGIVVGVTSIVSLVLVMVVFGEVYMLNNADSTALSRNATINGIDVGGMEVSKASEKVVTAFSNKADNFKLILKHNDEEWILDSEDFEINTNIHTILEEAYSRGTNSTNEIRRSNIDKITRSGEDISIAFDYVFVGLSEKIEEILATIETEPQDSEVIFNSRTKNKFTITDGENGLKVNREKLYQEINSQFMNQDVISVNLVLEEATPSITKEDNEKITHLVSSFSTNVSDSTGARKSNVRIALGKIDGLKVNPGESVSFNYLTGPHTKENGYKVATIIYNGKFVDGEGGGVCQASTTLYNALLKAGIQIDEVNKHTLPVMYVPLALDAMVSEYISDLRFTNNLDTPIFISAYCDTDRAYVDIYGAPLEEGVEYKTRSETIRTIPHGGDNIMVDTNKEYTDKVLFKGEYYRLSIPKNGYEVKAYLEKYKDGNLVEEILIRHETYQPQNGLVVEGAETPPENLKPIETNVVINR